MSVMSYDLSYNVFSFINCYTLFTGRSSRPEVFCKKDVLKNFAKFQSLILNKVAVLNFIKKETWQGCFPVNFAKFLRTPFFTEHLGDCFCT